MAKQEAQKVPGAKNNKISVNKEDLAYLASQVIMKL